MADEQKQTPPKMYEVTLSRAVQCGGLLLIPKNRNILSEAAVKECGDAVVKAVEVK